MRFTRCRRLVSTARQAGSGARLKDSDGSKRGDEDRRHLRILPRTAASMKNVTDNENVPSALSEQELQRLAEYFSILRDWSLQRDKA
jgi:hypothetical protein